MFLFIRLFLGAQVPLYNEAQIHLTIYINNTYYIPWVKLKQNKDLNWRPKMETTNSTYKIFDINNLLSMSLML